MGIDPLNQYEGNALLPLPTAAAILNVTAQELLVMLANQAHRIDGDHPVTGKKYPVTLYFHREDLGQPTGISISGRSDWEAKQFIFKLATDGAAELPPSFGHGPLRLEHRDVFLMVYIVRRLRFLMGTAPTTSGWARSPREWEETTPPPAMPKESPARRPGKGGRPKTQLRQGVEALYLEKLATGQTDILLPGAVEAFMEALKRSTTGPEVCEKVAGHIRELKKRSGRWLVFVHDPPEIDGKPPKANENPEGYTVEDVSKILSKLRRKHPPE